MLYAEKAKIKVTFLKPSDERITVEVEEGDSLLDAVMNNDVGIDGFGACEGELCCSSCHLIFKKEDFEKLNSVASDEEQDLLDLAFGVTDTSRLGCQVKLTKDMDGIEVIVPEFISDQRVN